MFYCQALIRFSKGKKSVMPGGDGYAPYVRISGMRHDLAVRVYGLPDCGDFDTDYKVQLELSYHPNIDYSELKNGQPFDLVMGTSIIGFGTVISDILFRDLHTKSPFDLIRNY
jgi:hypothetical protein